MEILTLTDFREELAAQLKSPNFHDWASMRAFYEKENLEFSTYESIAWKRYLDYSVEQASKDAWGRACDAQKILCAEDAANSEFLCGAKKNKDGKFGTECGKWCGGCDQPVFDKSSVLNTVSAPYVK